MKRLLFITALTLIPLLCLADGLQQLETQCGEAHGGLVKRLRIKGLDKLELVVVSDFESPNTALNPNVKHNKVDLEVSQKTAYLQTPDGSRGLKLVFAKGEFNRLKMFDKVVLDLNGCKVGKVEGTDALYVTDVTPLNIVNVTRGTESDVPLKERYISELTDRDIFTRVTIREAEFVFRDGAFVNIAEFHGQYVRYPPGHERCDGIHGWRPIQ